MDKNAIEFFRLLYSREQMAKMAGYDHFKVHVGGVIAREVAHILRVEGELDTEGWLKRDVEGESHA